MSVSEWRDADAEQGALFASYLAKTAQAERDAVLAALGVSATDKVVEIGGADAGLLDKIPVEADLYLLNGVLQNYDDAGVAAILRNCRAAMREGARLAIIERLMPERPADDPAAIMLDLHMLVVTGGKARTEGEMKALLESAALAVNKVSLMESGLSLIEARPSRPA
jgi:hypothetical protein